jgi:probable HAF family extracellular repeat protein
VAALWFAVVASLAGRPAAAQGAIRDLGTLGGPNSTALAVSRSGQVIGYSDTLGTDTLAGNSDAFLYDGSAMHDLTLGGAYSFPFGLNEAGQVTGYAAVADGNFHAFLGSAAGTVEIGTLPGGTFSWGIGVNNGGQVLGASDVPSFAMHTFVWTPDSPNSSTGKMVDIGALGGDSCSAIGITDGGQVAGSAATADGTPHAFIWTSAGGMVDLTPNAPGASSVTAMNAAGMVAGNMTVDGGHSHAFFYDGTLHDLGVLPGSTDSFATSISPAGLVAGGCGDHAVAWPSAAGIVDIGTLGGAISVAWGVNDGGQVFGDSDTGSGSDAFVYDGTGLHDLTLGGVFSQVLSGQLGSTLGGLANVADSGGRLAGFGLLPAAGGGHAFLYKSGTLTDLGTLGGNFSQANDVNSSGLVVGLSTLADNITQHAFISSAADSTAPSTTASLAGTAGKGGWFVSAVTVTLSAADEPGGSGVAATYYQVDGGAAQTYSTAFSLAGDGNHTLSYWSVDKAGNKEAPHSQAVNIDATAPSTSSSLAGTAGSGGWYRGAVAVTLSANDGTSGVGPTSYCVDGGGAQTYSGPFTVSGDGNHIVSFWSVDNAGNTEAKHAVAFGIDATAPSTSASLSGTAGSNGWYRGTVTVTLKAQDGGSGVAATNYCVDGGASMTYTGPFTVSGDGTHSVKFWSQDRAGNSETAQADSVTIDGTAPSVTAAANPNLLWPAGGQMVAVTMSGKITDATSGVDRTSASFSVADSYGALQPSGAITVAADGSYSFVVQLLAFRNGNDRNGRTYTVNVCASDNAGNRGSASTTVVVPHNH